MENQQWIAKQIYLKNMYASPYESRASDIQHVVTDIDHFPYTRFYRGIYNDAKPHLWEREAGFHPLQNNLYKDQLLYFTSPHQSPTQIPCSTILPLQRPFHGPLLNRMQCTVSPP